MITPPSNTYASHSLSVRPGSPGQWPLNQAGVIKATVISSTPSTKTGQEQTFTLRLQSSTQGLLDVIANKPMAAGTVVHIIIGEDKRLKITVLPSNNTKNAAAPTTQTTAGESTTNQRQVVIDTALRQALPQQQPIKRLLPLLHSFIQQAPGNTPKPLLNQVMQLLASFPNPEKLQDPKTLKQSIYNSGLFLEAKLATATKTSPPSLDKDIKAQLQQLIEQSYHHLKNRTQGETQQNPNRPQGLSTQTVHAFFQSLKSSTPSKSPTHSDSAEVLLRQLSKQLLSSLARIQFHQIDSASYKTGGISDTQSPLNTWVMDIPIVNGKHIDNLELHINHEQHTEKNTEEKIKQWTILLMFDLHKLGKMQVQLQVVDKTVAACIWSEISSTHKTVQRDLATLQENLTLAGVNVKKIDCMLGLPTVKTSTLQQQLVDIRT